jgi:pimeloyl-ACP methyl ester carboxylesterase
MRKKNFIYLLLTIVLASCGNRQDNTNEQTKTSTKKTATPKHFVFVPGAFHASWCWYKMQPLLNKDGNTSEAVDLPAHGQDTTTISRITLDSYVDAVCKILEKYNEPVVLIGHSLAGIVISQVAERMPAKIDKLVYICAFLIPNGESMVATALTDSASAMVSNQIFNEAEGWFFPKESIVKEAFYNDCSEEDVVLFSSLLTKEPNAPVGTPLQLSDERYGKVKKVYIHTTLDNTITYGLQKRMVERMPVDQTYELEASHSPFLSKPKELAGILLKL